MQSSALSEAAAGPARVPAPVEISILLVNWNTRKQILACLDSLPEAIPAGVAHETIVVDNGSLDGSAAALAERDDIVLIENERNVGYAAAVNQAYRRSSGAMVLLLNSDVELRPGALGTLRTFLQERPAIAGVGPRYLNPDGTLQHFYYRLPTFSAVLVNANWVLRRIPWLARRVRRYKMLDEAFEHAQPVEQPATSCLLVRRSALAEDAIFDERFPVFYNDVFLARSLAQRGLALWMTPEAVVVHEKGASVGQLGNAAKRQHLASLVTYLRASEPAPAVLLFQAMALVQGALRRLVDRSALPFGDLWRAVRGDGGPLPAAPDRWRAR